MRFILFLCAIEVALVTTVTALSRMRTHEADAPARSSRVQGSAEAARAASDLEKRAASDFEKRAASDLEKRAARDLEKRAASELEKRAARDLERRRAQMAIVAALKSAQGTFERRLTPEERAAGLAPELLDAILRMEGMLDPTRIGLFGPALRMRIRPGTASMSNVFGDRWVRAAMDPNVHDRVAYLADVWLKPRARDCDDFWTFRPDDTAIMLDSLTPDECRRLRPAGESESVAPFVQGVLSLPAFLAPYPGNRLTPAGMRSAQAARVLAVKERLWLQRPGLQRPGLLRTALPAVATARGAEP